jgi:ribosomal-protein-alanine N-acetyltransferase
VRQLTAGDKAAIVAWRYPGRYSTYDFDEPSVLDRDHWAVQDGGELIGYCCFGEPARVEDAGELAGTLDVGYGLAPGLMGQGRGRRFVAAILEFARERYDAGRARLFILGWNARSRAVAEGLGFAAVAHEGEFVVLVREL